MKDNLKNINQDVWISMFPITQVPFDKIFKNTTNDSIYYIRINLRRFIEGNVNIVFNNIKETENILSINILNTNLLFLFIKEII